MKAFYIRRGLLEGLKGHWTRKDCGGNAAKGSRLKRCVFHVSQEDRMSLGIISGNSMVWEAAYKHKPSPLWEALPFFFSVRLTDVR